MPQIYEYRGVEGLVAAPVVEDSTANFIVGSVIELAGVSEVGKATDSTNESHYYDNKAAIVITSEGADEITVNTSAIPLDVLANITGQFYDANAGMFVEQESTPGYWATKQRTQTAMYISFGDLKADSTSPTRPTQQRMTEQTQTGRRSLTQAFQQSTSLLPPERVQRPLQLIPLLIPFLHQASLAQCRHLTP